MTYIRRRDDISILPMEHNTVVRLRRSGVNTVGEMFDDPHGITEAGNWNDRLISGDEGYCLLEWGCTMLSRSGELYWSLDDGKLTVFGNGLMPDYTQKVQQPWMLFKEEIQTVFIDQGVKNVGARAFSDCPDLITVELKADVCRIGAQAFQHCSKLNRIVCEKKFLHRQEEAFHSSEVQAVYVGNKAFDGAPLLNKLFDEFYISHNILMEYLGNKTDVVIPEGVEEIGVMAFENCALSSVTFPESLKRINVCAFRGNQLHQLILPEKVETVDQWAFSDNPELELVSLKSRKIRIQPNAFSGTPVEPYAMPVDGRWGSLWEPEIKEDPSVVPYRRVELPPTPNNLIGVTTLNVQRTLRGFLMDGNILIQFFPNWKETGRAPLKIYQASNICSFVDRKFTVQHLPEEIKKVLPPKYQLPIRRVHSTISTAGLCRTRRENMPVWYAISYKDL